MPKDLALSDLQRRDLIRGYAAAVSFVDAQIGKVLEKLESLGLADDTIVVLWGDHGYFLGENGLWAKHNTMELATRSPLMIRCPGVGRPRPDRSLGRTRRSLPHAARSSRSAADDGSGGRKHRPLVGRSGTSLESRLRSVSIVAAARWGRSIRTRRYRYTEWRDQNSDEMVARVLFDHAIDPGENVNLAEKPSQADLVRRLSGLLAAGWRQAMA
ncbi:MAG: sulfatase-like hydrolase/transferase [Aquincola sp.]|nr:sulfatase-like hydrolase/transferase [Aquincola sp.]